MYTIVFLQLSCNKKIRLARFTTPPQCDPSGSFLLDSFGFRAHGSQTKRKRRSLYDLSVFYLSITEPFRCFFQDTELSPAFIFFGFHPAKLYSKKNFHYSLHIDFKELILRLPSKMSVSLSNSRKGKFLSITVLGEMFVR